MSNLSMSMGAASQALGVFERALGVVQSNIANSATRGYAKQYVNLQSQPFDSAVGLAGGVACQKLVSSRDAFAEEEVRRQLQSLGALNAQSEATGSIESLFDVSGNSGVTADLNALLQSFSSWSVSPSSLPCRETVLSAASDLASSIRSLAKGVNATATGITSRIGATVDEINRITSEIRDYNIAQGSAQSPDAGRDASLHANLEALSEYTGFDVVTSKDGTVTLLLAGGAPLVAGATQYPISLSRGADGRAEILDSQGADITDQATGGKLGGLLDIRNRLLPSFTGDADQPGSLNVFAQTLADTVNTILQSGSTSAEAGSPAGTALFVYTPGSVAATLELNPDITAGDLAPVDADGNANGNAIKLASLGESEPAGLNQSLVSYFSQIAASAGRESATAMNNSSAQESVLANTRTMRDQISGVSLDEQAMLLLQFQSSYQAVAKLLTTIDGLLDTTINLVRQ
jgi:flagellar hook-associated protein 1